MQICSVTVRVRGSLTHTVPNKEVTVPEIKILQLVHGGVDAVGDIRPIRFEPNFDHDGERQRLRKIYERGSGNADTARGMVARAFGTFGKLPTTLKAIGIDPKESAAKLREQAAAAEKAADELENAQEAPAEDLTDDELEAIREMQKREADDDGKTPPAVVETDDDEIPEDDDLH